MLLCVAVSAGLTVNSAGDAGGEVAPNIFPTNRQRSDVVALDVLRCIEIKTNIAPPTSWAQASLFVKLMYRVAPPVAKLNVIVVYVGSPLVVGAADSNVIPACNRGLMFR
jgi:hypothetical protein